MISITKNINGTYTASAFVSGDGMTWLLSRTFYYMPKRMALKAFREFIKEQNLKLSK